MFNILLAGVGGQGTVLAAKILAQAAQNKGWQVRTAETIGMAQRGGNVVSHVRMGNEGEPVHAPLVTSGTAQAIIAFEPGEGARVLPYLAPGGTLVCASSAVQPVSAALAAWAYKADEVLEGVRESLACFGGQLITVDDAEITAKAGSKKTLNIVLLASAVAAGAVPLSLDELKEAVAACVKPQFIEMNLCALEAAVAAL